MPSDALDQMSDADVTMMFAREVAGLLMPAYWEGSDFPFVCRLDPEGNRMTAFPHFATDANAVLPWLEKHAAWSKGTVGSAVSVYGRKMSPVPKPEGVADSDWMVLHVIGHHWNEAVPRVSFARAACIALIRAARYKNPSCTITVHDGNGNNPTELTKEQYDALCASGMMWEFHPDAPQRWPYASE